MAHLIGDQTHTSECGPSRSSPFNGMGHVGSTIQRRRCVTETLWLDNWIGDKCLADAFLSLFAVATYRKVTVSSYINSNNEEVS